MELEQARSGELSYCVTETVSHAAPTQARTVLLSERERFEGERLRERAELDTAWQARGRRLPERFLLRFVPLTPKITGGLRGSRPRRGAARGCGERAARGVGSGCAGGGV